MAARGRPSYVDLLSANEYLQKAADSFYFMCTTRTVQESKLYPVSPYIAMSYLNAWFRWPELLRKVDAAMPAEEIGDRARQVGTYTNIVTASLIPNFYFGGREILLDMGLLKPTDALDDMTFVLDFSRRLSLAYQRPSAHILPSDAGYKMQLHTSRQTEAFEAAALGVVPGDELHTAFARFMAAMSTYGFLSHCENRLSFCNHGPYRTASGDEMLVRDAVDLAECDYPWMDGVSKEIEHNNITVTVILKDTHFDMVDDWGSFEARPAYDLDNLVAVGVYTSDWLSDGYIPVAMENAGSLAAFLDDQAEKMERATARMWTMMAGWTREQMIDAGALVYYAGAKELAHFAGVYEQDDWFLIDDRAELFKPLMNDEYGGSLIAEIVGHVSLSSQQGAPGHMARYSGERGEMWTGIPYSVLADEAWTSGVDPIDGGDTTLPPKTAAWTTTRGKLTQAECNAAARAFGSTAHDLRFFDDDTWRKFNPDDERTRALEEAARPRATRPA
jgi:hypothetical protein